MIGRKVVKQKTVLATANFKFQVLTLWVWVHACVRPWVFGARAKHVFGHPCPLRVQLIWKPRNVIRALEVRVCGDRDGGVWWYVCVVW